ncbi:response regulator [Methylobacterium oryzisoli]|uniref:response regulator n=1 Tax=Methylobacterium oryzisoli TaxID=3385502 RepID=UPI0038923C97
MPLAHTTSLPIVLVVEDEDLIRATAVDLLEEAGFAVIEADSAHAAWTILEADPTISALFSDVEMPGSMNGLELAERVAARWPHIHLVLTSGRHMLSSLDGSYVGRFVPKPYDGHQLLRAFTARTAGVVGLGKCSPSG